MARLFSEEEVAKHNSAFNCWLVLGSHGAKKVYDVTAFLEDHPGGPEVLLDLAGQDAEDEFQDVGHSKAARAMVEELYIGDLKEDGEQRAISEANKISRRSLLTHPELIQRSGKLASSHTWTSASTTASVIVVAIGFLLAWAYLGDCSSVWEAILAAWTSWTPGQQFI